MNDEVTGICFEQGLATFCYPGPGLAPCCGPQICSLGELKLPALSLAADTQSLFYDSKRRQERAGLLRSVLWRRWML